MCPGRPWSTVLIRGGCGSPYPAFGGYLRCGVSGPPGYSSVSRTPCRHPLRAPRRRSEAKRTEAASDNNTMSFSEPDTDIVVPAFDVRALARRAAVPAAVAAAAAATLVVAGGPLHAFAHALRRALDADPRWVIGGAIFELLSFAGYVALFWMVGSRATGRLGLSESTQVTLGGAAATRLLPTAGVGGAAMTLWALRKAGLGSRAATRTLLGFLIVLYSVFLGAIAVSGGLIALGVASADGPLALSAIPGAAATLAIAGAWPWAPARRGRSRAAPPACTRPPTCSAAPCATRSGTSAQATRACSARWPGGRSTPRSCGRCSMPSARRPPSRRRARLLRRPGRQHDPDPGRRERRDRRRPRRLRRAGGPRARLGPRLPRHRHLAARRRSASPPSARCAGRWRAGPPRTPRSRSWRATPRRCARARAGRAGAAPVPEHALLAA